MDTTSFFQNSDFSSLFNNFSGLFNNFQNLKNSTDGNVTTVVFFYNLTTNLVPEENSKSKSVLYSSDYVGCYSSEYVESNPDYYKIKSPVPWKNGYNTCVLRFTSHIAVASDKGSPGRHTFFCGNDMLNYSNPVDDSRCQKCGEEDGRFCGGAGAVAIQKITDFPFYVYVGISGKDTSTIKQVTKLGNSTVLTVDTGMWEMNYFYEDGAFWYTNDKTTYRYVLDPVVFRMNKEKTVTVCGSTNRSPSFDWVNKRVYIGCSEERKIYELDLEGNLIKTYDTKLDRDIKSLHVDPYRKIAFVLTKGQRVHTYSLETGSETLVSNYEIWFKADVMTVDTHKQNIYIIGERENETDKVLVKKEYRDVGIDLIYQGPELANVLAMDYYDGTVVWSTNNSPNVVYTCKLTPTCKKEDIKKIYSESNQTIVDVKVQHPLKQTPDTAGLCSQLGCSHTCTRVSLFEAKCECPWALTLMADKKTCAEYVGCFTSEFAESHPYYRIKNSLSWNQGKAACTNRLTTHMAVSPDLSSLGDYMFFCGNDLAEHSVSVEASRCLKCYDDNNRFCGGKGLVSIYRLRESTPFSVLVSVTKIDVIQITEENGVNALKTVVPLLTFAWDLSYFYQEDAIWITSENGTYGSTYDPVLSRYSKQTKVPTCNDDNRNPLIDWVNNRVIYGCTGENKIIEMDLKGNVMQTHELDLERYAHHIALDPYKKLLFLTTWGDELYTYSLETKILTKFPLKFPRWSLEGKAMALDHHEKNLYLVGKLNEGNKANADNALVRVNYETREGDILYKGPELKDIWGIDYFDGTAVWVHRYPDDKSYKRVDLVYKCTLTPKCQKENLKVIYNDFVQKYLDVKIYHPLKQTPDTAGLCSELGCSHTCTRESLFHAKCKCPSSLVLQSDKRTCSTTALAILQQNPYSPSDKQPRRFG